MAKGRSQRIKKAASKAADLITSGKVPLDTVETMKISKTTAEEVASRPVKNLANKVVNWASRVMAAPGSATRTKAPEFDNAPIGKSKKGSGFR